MGINNSLYLLASILFMTAQGDQIFDIPKRRGRYVPAPPNKDLPAWKVGESVIHAKDEKTAVKYAKKRGLWMEGMVVEKGGAI